MRKREPSVKSKIYPGAWMAVLLLLGGCTSGTIVIENAAFRYEMDSSGRNLHFIDKSSNTDYLDTVDVSYCSSIEKDGKRYNVTGVSRKGKFLSYEFGEAQVSAVIRLTKSKDHILFKVESVTGEPASLTLINVPLSLEAMPCEPFAACALSMNLFTYVPRLPALQSHLEASCYERFGMKGAEIAMLGVPQQDILPTIREIITNAEDIPFSDKGGAWAQLQPEGYGSYLMNFGTLTEESVDEWIEMVNSLGFNQIDNHGGSRFFTFGDFKLDPEKWPDGWESFRRINKRLHEAGISSIFHTYAFFIDKDSKYVTPVPHPDLGYFNAFTLAKPIGADNSEITVRESTADISTITGFFIRNSVTLRIGDELITFTGVTDTPPYRFTGCKRGVNGSTAAAHTTEEQVFHLKEMFGRFVPGPATPLFDEIARRSAEIVNQCGFDGIYFDAIDGSDILGGAENAWYYGTQFIFKVAAHLETPVGMEMSSMKHHWWHYRSRWQAWDRPVRGYKRFVDIHAAAIKTDEHEHGVWRGNTPLIEKYAPAENGALLLPLHFGWWGNQTWNPPQVEPTFPDDIEYLCCKMIGNDAGLSMLGGVDKKTIAENPLYARLIPVIKQYEELRHEHYFNDSVRAILRQPGKEFTLVKEGENRWNFKPVSYLKHKVAGTDHPSAQWTVNNTFDTQPVQLRIEPLMSVKPYQDPSGVVLADFTDPAEFIQADSARGVSGAIKTCMEHGPGYKSCGIVAASSTGASGQAASWINLEKGFEPSINLENNRGIGVWVKGDGNGELLNLSIKSPEHISHGARGDHFIRIDFTGWKYFELVEIESSEFSNYIWPESYLYVYDSYRHTVAFDNVNKLQIWYNNLPGGKEVACRLSPVMALPLVPVTITNPELTIGEKRIIFPVKLESGMYMELRSTTGCRIYGPNGGLLQELSIQDEIPDLKAGNNAISFNCGGPEDISARVQVTVISEGDPL